jgi:hypothetical protein
VNQSGASSPCCREGPHIVSPMKRLANVEAPAVIAPATTNGDENDRGERRFDRSSRGHSISMANRWLSIYLRDHHAASAGGVALASRALGSSHPLAEQIAGDRKTLEELMRTLGVPPSAMKVGFVRTAEWLGRLKLNGRLFKHSPLSRIVELETLVVGIRGKEALWTALRTAGANLQGIDLDALIESARRQAKEIDEQRLIAVADVFNRSRTQQAQEDA